MRLLVRMSLATADPALVRCDNAAGLSNRQRWRDVRRIVERASFAERIVQLRVIHIAVIGGLIEDPCSADLARRERARRLGVPLGWAAG